jgi:hypothetical protein
MSVIIDGTSGLTSPAAVLTTTPLAVTSGGTGVTTSTGSGAGVHATAPTITGATITVAATAAPAFSAYLSATQNVTSNVYTKVACNTEEFDTNSNYDNATNYRFTPTVAGYYQVNARIHQAGNFITNCDINIYKNGSQFKGGGFISLASGAATSDFGSSLSALIYLNGSTDYIELYGLVTVSVSNARFYAATAVNTYFQAAMIRSA